MESRLWTLLIVFLFGIYLSLPTVVRGQTKVWVSSAGARLQTDRTASSTTVATLPVGAELTVLSTKAPWYEVATGAGVRGWIYRGKVSASPPQTQEESGGGGLFSVLPGSSIQTQTADTSRSIRGLSPEASVYADRTRQPRAYREALDSVLSMNVADAELERFLKEGRIGEYAP